MNTKKNKHYQTIYHANMNFSRAFPRFLSMNYFIFVEVLELTLSNLERVDWHYKNIFLLKSVCYLLGLIQKRFLLVRRALGILVPW